METTKLTISEALAEVKMLGQRILKRREALRPYIIRSAAEIDPLADKGGSVAYLAQEMQAIEDLENRLLAIRRAIQAQNLESKVEVDGDRSETVQTWLNWRREILPARKTWIEALIGGIAHVRQEERKQGRSVVPAGSETERAQVVVNLDETELIQARDKLLAIEGKLDGRLSVYDATTVIEIPQ